MVSIHIEKVNQEDTDFLQQISKQTFYETFAEQNTAEDMDKYLSEQFSLDKINEELSNENSEFYFAKIQNEIAGYLKLNYAEAQTELKEEKALEIERIYVLKKNQGLKIGKSLFEFTLKRAQQKDINYIWLGVWEKNSKAIQFYTKNGFTQFSSHVFKLGDDLQTDLLMKLELKNI